MARKLLIRFALAADVDQWLPAANVAHDTPTGIQHRFWRTPDTTAVVFHDQAKETDGANSDPRSRSTLWIANPSDRPDRLLMPFGIRQSRYPLWKYWECLKPIQVMIYWASYGIKSPECTISGWWWAACKPIIPKTKLATCTMKNHIFATSQTLLLLNIHMKSGRSAHMASSAWKVFRFVRIVSANLWFKQ